MLRKYRYEVRGLTGDNVAWKSGGEVECEFPLLFTTVMERTFDDLTNGKAVFGMPGIGGCKGPYEVLEIRMERGNGTRR